MRIGGVAFSQLDIPGVSKRQRSEPACTCGGGKLGETRTELVVRFWPKAVAAFVIAKDFVLMLESTRAIKN